STPTTGHASVQVFDLSGRTVDTLVNEEVAAGNHSVSWTPGTISSGVYFVRLTTPSGTVSTQAMVLR
ncbi:MAG: T9SS type A sorting domain-containing protein, partial [bacterium]|nr:T9SS type A sorting domain-containing protein [bacterium]